ncbi:MAG: metalloenzyme domain protein [Clostridiales bacterium]|jgi:2,3-bisphosphoglycerate-independent phosphoglycerate mutase|nr:metalloenzyme domain protein [Clostridiales bacterium]
MKNGDTMRMIFLFIDGFGIGEVDSSKNPIFAANAPNIQKILEYGGVFATDASLNIPGLPQSATGQTTIFTGVNASAILGRHLSGQPTITLKKLISENNLFKELVIRGLTVTYANVYRDEYLGKIHESKDRRLRPSVTTVMAIENGLKLRNIDDYQNGLGVYHDITGQIIKDSGYDVDIITAEEAGKRLYNISRAYDFTLYEHFVSDIIGHKGDMKAAIEEIELLDRFIGELLRCINLTEDVLFITSDHGNIEDMHVKTHTYNKVPSIVLGNYSEKAVENIKTLADIMPAVLNIFDEKIEKET